MMQEEENRLLAQSVVNELAFMYDLVRSLCLSGRSILRKRQYNVWFKQRHSFHLQSSDAYEATSRSARSFETHFAHEVERPWWRRRWCRLAGGLFQTIAAHDLILSADRTRSPLR